MMTTFLSLADFVDRARRRLIAVAPSVEVASAIGDHAVDPSLIALRGSKALQPAAVLVPIVAREQPTVLLTLRTEHLPSHKGQIAFPGGKTDSRDASPLATALREAEEEIGLHSVHVDPLGYLDVYETTSGYRIVPVVAQVNPPFVVRPNPSEVDEVFEVPLAFLMDAANHQDHQREWQGRMRRYTAMPFGERYIWGVTAGILKNLHARVLG
jgi:8-oxo-dGTP pyrophosphatase MutT (NUDIX family)